MPEDGHYRADILPLEAEVWWFGSFGAEAVEAVGGRESEIEATGCGFEFGQEDVAGRVVKKVLRPAGKRKAVEFFRLAYDVSERRACRAIRFQRSSYRYRSIKEPQAPLRMRIKELGRDPDSIWIQTDNHSAQARGLVGESQEGLPLIL